MWGELGCQEVQEWSLLTWEPFPALMPPVPCPSVLGALSLFSPPEKTQIPTSEWVTRSSNAHFIFCN